MASLVASRREIGEIIRAEARAQGVPVAFAQAVAWQESGWQPEAVSGAGAVGVMQLTPPTADWVASTILGHRIDLHDAHSNVQAGVALLRHYLERYHGDRQLALAAYFQGQTAADRHGVYPVTRPYIASILALERFFAG
jgi:soluble lytic murein transglycosylase-like protein